MAKELKTIGVLTSGGDAPGMNAAIRAVVRRGLSKGLKMKGILKGYDGLLNEEIIDMTAKDVSDIIGRGGTILYTARLWKQSIKYVILLLLMSVAVSSKLWEEMQVIWLCGVVLPTVQKIFFFRKNMITTSRS